MGVDIDAAEVRRLVTQLGDKHLPSTTEAKARDRLNRLADDYHFATRNVSADDCPERDDAIADLAGRGSQSFAQYMYGDDF